MTDITYITKSLEPLEMWVEGNTAWDYETQGFEIVEYEPPPPWLIGVWSGKAKIRKTGGPTFYTWSPELAALHKKICRALDSNAPPYGKRYPTPAQSEWHKGHSQLFGEMGYHETLMRPQDTDSLEDVQKRIADALKNLAENAKHKMTKQAWFACANDIEIWRYEERKP